ncbi:hypothetical protein SynBMKMC1_01318 [Synechococcus sp. BMK-MC-1]|nr:hypothetical protein SynBMKMC1_01318 [Synechococcus sp. BMK-MC-1]
MEPSLIASSRLQCHGKVIQHEAPQTVGRCQALPGINPRD